MLGAGHKINKGVGIVSASMSKRYAQMTVITDWSYITKYKYYIYTYYKT